jgi:hypothetical protein
MSSQPLKPLRSADSVSDTDRRATISGAANVHALEIGMTAGHTLDDRMAAEAQFDAWSAE